MSLILKKLIVPAFVVLAFLLLCVRPAQAFTCSFLGSPGSGESLNLCAKSAEQNRAVGYGQTITTCTLLASASVCLSASGCSVTCNSVAYSPYRTDTIYFSGSCAAPTVLQPDGTCLAPPPPPDCAIKTGESTPHLNGDGSVPAFACFDSCKVDIQIGGSATSNITGLTFWVGWGQYTGDSCSVEQASSISNPPVYPEVICDAPLIKSPDGLTCLLPVNTACPVGQVDYGLLGAKDCSLPCSYNAAIKSTDAACVAPVEPPVVPPASGVPSTSGVPDTSGGGSGSGTDPCYGMTVFGCMSIIIGGGNSPASSVSIARTVDTAALNGLYADGDLIAGKTVSSVIGDFKTRVLSSGVGSAIGGFFTVNQAAGTCPVWSANIPMFGTMSFDFFCQSTFQNLLPWIKSVLLLIFSVMAFRIAVL